MKRGFTLIELLGIIVVLGVIATIVTPIIQNTLSENKDSVYNSLMEQIKGDAKDYLSVNSELLPENENDSIQVKIGDIKKAGLIQINIKNPKSDNIISNESYVTVTKKGNNYIYNVVIYDLTDVDETLSEGAPIISVNKNSNETISIGSTYEFTETVTVDGTENSDVSRQIIKDNKEVASIDTSVKGIYEIYYSKLKDGKLGITIRTIRVA